MAYGVSGAYGGTPITWLYTQVDTVQQALADVTRRLTLLEERVEGLAAEPLSPPQPTAAATQALEEAMRKQGANVKRLHEALQVLCVSVHQLEAFHVGPPPLTASPPAGAQGDPPRRPWEVYSDDDCESLVGDGGAATPAQSLAFMMAVCRGEEARALLLLDDVGGCSQASPFGVGSLRDVRGRSALHLAAARGLVDLVRELMTHRPLREALDGCQRTPVHHAAARGRGEVCKIILDHPDFAHADNADVDGFTALHCAAGGGHAGTCQLLLGHRRFRAADAVDCLQRTALHVAARHGHTGVCQVLLEHGAFRRVWAADCDGRMALHCAASRGYSEVCRVLVEHRGFREHCLSNDDGAAYRSALLQAQGGARVVLEEAGAGLLADRPGPEPGPGPGRPPSRRPRAGVRLESPSAAADGSD